MSRRPGHREIEIKRMLLGEQAAERLAATLGSRSLTTRQQVNHLLDTADRALRRARCALRLLEESALRAGRADPVELLRKATGGRGFANLWRAFERALAGRPVRPIGSFENQRTTLPVMLPGGLALTIELDRTLFPDGRIDSEVEIEFSDARDASDVEAWLDLILHDSGLNSSPSSSQIARFHESLTQPIPR